MKVFTWQLQLGEFTTVGTGPNKKAAKQVTKKCEDVAGPKYQCCGSEHFTFPDPTFLRSGSGSFITNFSYRYFLKKIYSEYVLLKFRLFCFIQNLSFLFKIVWFYWILKDVNFPKNIYLFIGFNFCSMPFFLYPVLDDLFGSESATLLNTDIHSSNVINGKILRHRSFIYV